LPRSAADARADASAPGAAAAAAAAAKKLKIKEARRSPAQRIKDALARITAPSAFASAPEAPIWNPAAAFAATTPELGAFGGGLQKGSWEGGWVEG